MELTRLVAVLVLFSASSGAAEPPPGTDPVVAARVADRIVTYAELDRRALAQDVGRFRGLRLRDAIYEARRTALDGLIADHLIAVEADRERLSREALVERGIAASFVPVTDADVESWFKANQARLNGATLESVSSKIRLGLEDQRRTEARSRFVDRLRSRASITVALAPPREALTVTASEPADGPIGAPVQIVMYSDYQCPFCARVEPTLEKVKQAYGERVRIVFRDFPLTSIHPRATDAAKAAHCAHEQGRFWEYHDRLFSNQGRMAASDLLQHATDIGLDTARFTTCAAGEGVEAIVRANTASGEALGVSATPAFFVNGRFMPGAQPFEAFQRVIEDELRSAQK
jgi:protein-disulfide isomerase